MVEKPAKSCRLSIVIDAKEQICVPWGRQRNEDHVTVINNIATKRGPKLHQLVGHISHATEQEPAGNLGTIGIQLRYNSAPITSSSFLDFEDRAIFINL